jgi:hypothetical protein
VINPLEGMVEDRIDGKTGLAKKTLDELPAFTFAPEEGDEEAMESEWGESERNESWLHVKRDRDRQSAGDEPTPVATTSG